MTKKDRQKQEQQQANAAKKQKSKSKNPAQQQIKANKMTKKQNEQTEATTNNKPT